MTASPDAISRPLVAAQPARPARPAGVVLPVDPLREPAWDTLIAAQPGSSFFHSAAWARVLVATYGHTPLYFCRRRRDRVDQLLPVMEVRSPFTGCRGVSLPFTDSCPPLAPESPDAAELYEEILQFGRTRGWKYFEARPASHWPGATPSVSYWSHRLDLTPGEAGLRDGLDDSTRRSLQKAERSDLIVERAQSESAMREFYRLHCATRRRHGVPPQPYRFFDQIARHVLSAGLGSVFTIKLGCQPIAAAVFFQFGRQALYKFGASDAAYQQLRPNNLLMWEAIKHYSATGCATLDYGRTSLADEGLRRFKLGFGAAESSLSYGRFDFATNAFVTTPDRAHGWFNSVFQRLPGSVLRWAGATLYPHLS